MVELRQSVDDFTIHRTAPSFNLLSCRAFQANYVELEARVGGGFRLPRMRWLYHAAGGLRGHAAGDSRVPSLIPAAAYIPSLQYLALPCRHLRPSRRG